MSNVTAAPPAESQLGLIFQYTVEAYKTFQKLAENLPNPLAAATFKNFARDERELRDLLEVKHMRSQSVKVTLGGDLRFQEIIEGDLAYREITEMLIVRERTIAQRLTEAGKSGPAADRNLWTYVAATKRAHLAYLERELELIRIYPDWYEREDAETLVVNGEPNEA